MSSVNSITISGNLTRDAILRETAAGTPVASFAVAVDDRKKNAQTGEWETVAYFFNCCKWGNGAPGLSQILKKGMKVTVMGKLTQRAYEAKDGSKRIAFEINADAVDFMGGKREDAEQPDPALYDEDVPF